MKKLLTLIVVGWGAFGIYRGFDVGLPASPHGGYQWGNVAAFGVAVVAVLLGTLSLWRGLSGDHAPIGNGTALLVLVLAVAATAGMMRRSGGITARECAAALDHMRELIAAKDRTGQMLARFDAQRSVLAAGCKGAGDARQRRCVLAATSFDELERCPQ